jgi:HSP20 family protein
MERRENTLPMRREETRAPSLLEPFWGRGFFGGSPFEMLRRVHEDMDRLFGEALPIFAGYERWEPRVDISQTDKEWLIEAELPGVSADQVQVELKEHHLYISAEMKSETAEEKDREYIRKERRYGAFRRVMALPENVDEEGVRAEFKDGVLKVYVPKVHAVPVRGRRIPVGTGTATETPAVAEAAGS